MSASSQHRVSNPLPRNLYFLRHGESLVNLGNRLHRETGEVDLLEQLQNHHTSRVPLSLRGRHQAVSTGKYLRGSDFQYRIDRRIVSSYDRAKETAALLHLVPETAPFDEWWEESKFIYERLWGRLESYSGPKVGHDEEPRPSLKRHPFKLAKWTFERIYWREEIRELRSMQRDGLYAKPAGGEALIEVINGRLHNFFENLRNESSQDNVLVVCHGEIINLVGIIIEEIPSDEYSNPYQGGSGRKIRNCELVHYSRVNPTDAQDVRDEPTWKRIICPWDRNSDLEEWRTITRPRFTDNMLLERARQEMLQHHVR